MAGLSRWIRTAPRVDPAAALARRGTNTTRVDTPHGSFLTLQDRSGALLCPVCGARFYNPRDLVWHLAYHARAQERR